MAEDQDILMDEQVETGDPQPKLREQDRVRLDSIVQRMIRNRESDVAIRTVVDDFKRKYMVLSSPEAMPAIPKPAVPKPQQPAKEPQLWDYGFEKTEPLTIPKVDYSKPVTEKKVTETVKITPGVEAQKGKAREETAIEFGTAVKKAQKTLYNELTTNDDVITKVIKAARYDKAAQEQMDKFALSPRSDMPGVQSAAMQVDPRLQQEVAPQDIPVTSEDIEKEKQKIATDELYARNILEEVARVKPEKSAQIQAAIYKLDVATNISEDPNINKRLPKILQNVKDLEKGKLLYNPRNGQLVKPENIIQSFKTAWKHKEQNYEDFEKFRKIENNEAIAMELDDRMKNADPDEPLPIPSGTMGTLGSAFGGMPLKVYAAGAIGGLAGPGGSILAASGVGAREAYKLGWANEFQRAYYELRKQGASGFEAVEKARKQADNAANIDAAVGGLTGAIAARIPYRQMTPVNFSGGFRKSLVGALKGYGQVLSPALKEGILAGGVAAAGETYKNELAKEAGINRDASENVLEVAEMNLLMPLAIGVLAGAAKISKSGYRHLMQGLHNIPEGVFNNALTDAVGRGIITEEQATSVKNQVDEYGKVDNTIPENIAPEARVEIQGLIERRSELEKQIENTDKAFHPELKEKVKAIEEKITELSKDRVKPDKEKNEIKSLIDQGIEEGLPGFGGIMKDIAQNDPTGFMKFVADQALGRTETGAMSELGNAEYAAREAFGDGLVDRAIKMFPYNEADAVIPTLQKPVSRLGEAERIEFIRAVLNNDSEKLNAIVSRYENDYSVASLASEITSRAKQKYQPATKEEIARITSAKSPKEVLEIIAETTKDDSLRDVANVFLKNIDKADFLSFAIDIPKDRHGYPVDAWGSYGGGKIHVREKAFWSPKNNYFNRGLDAGYGTVLHEFTHAFTIDAYRKPKTPIEKEFKSYIDKTYKELKSNSEFAKQYGFKSPEEFIAEVLANPEFRLASSIYKKGFIDKVIDFLSRIFSRLKGVDKDEKSDARYAKMKEAFDFILKSVPNIRAGKGKDIYYEKIADPDHWVNKISDKPALLKRLGFSQEEINAALGPQKPKVTVSTPIIRNVRAKEGAIPEFDIQYQEGKPTGTLLQGKELIAEGSESTVYRDGDTVIKVSEPYNDASTFNARVEDARIISEQLGDGSVELIGTYKSKNGTPNPIFRQKFIEGEKATPEQIDAYMESKGFQKKNGGWENDQYRFTDIDSDNAIIDADGNVHIIDAGVKKLEPTVTAKGETAPGVTKVSDEAQPQQAATALEASYDRLLKQGEDPNDPDMVRMREQIKKLKNKQDAIPKQSSASVDAYTPSQDRGQMGKGIPESESTSAKGQAQEEGGVNLETPEGFILKYEDLQKVAEEFGFESVRPRERKSDVKLFADARKQVDSWIKDGSYENNITKLLNRAANKEGLNDQDNVVLSFHIASLRAKLRGMDVDSPGYDKIINDLQYAKDVGQIARGEQGAALRTPTFRVNPIEDIGDAMVAKKEAVGVDELTPQQKQEVKDLVDKYQKASKKANEAVDDLADKVITDKADKALTDAKKKSSGKRKTSEQYKTERKSFMDELKAARDEHIQKLKEQGIQQAGGIPVYLTNKMIKAISKIAYSHAEEAAFNLAETVKRVYEEVKDLITDITEKDIHNILAGEYNEKRPPLSELQRNLKDLKEEAKRINELEALESGPLPKDEAKRVKRNQRIKVLRDTIKGIRDYDRMMSEKEAQEYKALETERNRQLEKVQTLNEKLGRLRQGIIDSKTKRPQKVDTPEIESLKKQVKEEEAKLREMDSDRRKLIAIKKRNQKQEQEILQKIKNKEFDEPKERTSIFDDPEVKRKYSKERKEALDAIVAREDAQQKFKLALFRDEQAKRSKLEVAGDFGAKLIATSKSLLSGIDDSATFVQNYWNILTNPKEGGKAWIDHWKDAFSPARMKREQQALKNAADWEIIEKSELQILGMESDAAKAVEEAFNDNLLAQKFKVRGKEIDLWTRTGGTFERAFVSLGNNLRINLFRKRMQQLRDDGKTFESHPQEYKDAARVINEMTARGKQNKYAQLANPIITPIIWAPRMIASSLNQLGISDLVSIIPGAKKVGAEGYYRTLTPAQRTYALTQLGKSVGLGVAAMAVASYGGADVDWDPRSVTFGNIKIGTKSYNMFGRYAPYIKTIVQTVSGTRIKPGGKIRDLDSGKFGAKTRLGIVGGFLRGKTTPFAGAMYDLVQGRQYFTNEEFGVSDLPEALLQPMSIRELREGWEQDGTWSLLTRFLPAFEGMKVSDERDFKR